jgi:hypothetical protein
VTGDLPALAVQTVAPLSGPRGVGDPFGRLTFRGGAYHVPAGLSYAPELVLGVEQDPATGAPVPAALVNGATGGLKVNARRVDSAGWTTHLMGDANYTWPPQASWGVAPGGGPYAVRDLLAGEQLDVEFSMPLGANLGAGSGVQLRLIIIGSVVDAGYWSNSNAAAYAVPTRLAGSLDGPLTGVTYQLQAQRVGNQPNMQAAGLAAPYLRHRIVPT